MEGHLLGERERHTETDREIDIQRETKTRKDCRDMLGK